MLTDGKSMSREPTKTIRKIVQRGIDCTPKSYRRAATQRLQVAKFLLKHSSHYLDVIYLAGYAVECSLKALILERTPKSKWSAVGEEISSGAKGHNLDFLKSSLNLRHCAIPHDTTESLDVIKCEWNTSLRYVGAVVPIQEAKSFIEHVISVYDWAERST